MLSRSITANGSEDRTGYEGLGGEMKSVCRGAVGAFFDTDTG